MNRLSLARRAMILVLLWAVAGHCQAGTEAGFGAGVTAYEAGQFAVAAREFRAAAGVQPAAGTLLNLGLAEWRRGRVGPALVAWEQVLWVAPGDARARGNLRYAWQFTGVAPPEYRWYERVSTWLPANAWAWLAAGSLWLAIGLWVLAGVGRWRPAGWQSALAVLGLVVFLLSVPAQFGVYTRSRIGLVLAPEVALGLTPTAGAEVVAKLGAGEAVRELRRRGDYVLVRTPRGVGWMERACLGRLGSE